MKKNILFGFLNLILFVSSYAAKNTSLVSKIQFLNVEKASALLLVPDDYANNMSQFDINARLRKQHGTKEEIFTNLVAQIREWTPQEVTQLKAVIMSIDKSINENGFKLNLPTEINLIKSTMLDEGGAEGYTRANCIVINQAYLQQDSSALRDLVLHELFHVATRYDVQFKRNMYKIIGFEIMNEVAYPDQIKEMKISNPDAPKKDSYITVLKNGKPAECMMILYADRPYTEGSFFDYLQIGLLKLKGKSIKELDMEDGKPIIYTIESVTNFFEQIGRNTAYIIDPEEALADNFVFAINNKKDLASQWVVDNMQERLKTN